MPRSSIVAIQTSCSLAAFLRFHLVGYFAVVQTGQLIVKVALNALAFKFEQRLAGAQKTQKIRDLVSGFRIDDKALFRRQQFGRNVKSGSSA